LPSASGWSSGSSSSSRTPICEVSDLRRGIPIYDVRMVDIEADEVRQVGTRGSKKSAPVELGGFSIEGISIGGHETCVMVPGMRMAFDIGRCPQRAISQDFLFISHAHMDHIGGIAMYVATRGLYKMRPPTVFVPKCIKATVEKLIEVYRELDGSELALRLVGLDIGEEYDLGKGYVVKPFRTYHVVPSQGYVIYSVKKKLKPEFMHLPGTEIKVLRLSGVEIVNVFKIPEVAFTGDTTADFIVDESNKDALEAKLLIMEATFVDEAMSVDHARDYGHVHLSEVTL
jgi:ribonuclease Z